MALNFCPSCGAKLASGAGKFCTTCGKPLPASAAAQQPAQPPAPSSVPAFMQPGFAAPAAPPVTQPAFMNPAAAPPVSQPTFMNPQPVPVAPKPRNVVAAPPPQPPPPRPDPRPASDRGVLHGSGDRADSGGSGSGGGIDLSGAANLIEVVGGVAGIVGGVASLFGGSGSSVAQIANTVANIANTFNRISLPNGRQVVIGGYRKDPHDDSDTHYERHREVDPESLAGVVDLRRWMTPVEDQGDLGSCTANAIAGAYEYLAKRTRGHSGDVSRLFIYYLERKMQGQEDEDAGGYLRDGMKVLKKYGVCSESTWPYDVDRFKHEPPDHAFDEAKNHTIDEYHRIPIDVDAMRACLAEGYPFVFGMQIFKAFESHDHHGRIRMPRRGDKNEGGHAMLCCGYSDEDRVFIVRNSWGTDWGDEGYCYVPFDYLANEEFTHDCWTLRRAHNMDFESNEESDDSHVRRKKKASIFGGFDVEEDDDEASEEEEEESDDEVTDDESDEDETDDDESENEADEDDDESDDDDK